MSHYHTNKHMFINSITLLVKDLNVSQNFYETILGFTVKNKQEDTLDLYAGSTKLITLIENKNALQTPSLGLYHFALLVSSKAKLAHVVKQFIDTKYQITGASDHGVSEALYLDDPDGNGIEIYYDRPTLEWPLDDGKTTMYTRALNFTELMRHLPSEPYHGIDPLTVMGHVHFHVDEIANGKAFFVDILGYNVVISYAQGSALFLSDQNYHHHIGLNVWSNAISYRSENQVGLVGYTLQVPSAQKEMFLNSLEKNQIQIANQSLTDPLGHLVTLDFV